MEILQQKINQRLEEGLLKQEDFNPKEVIVTSLFGGMLKFSIIETLGKNGKTYFAEAIQGEVIGFTENGLKIDFGSQVSEGAIVAKDFGIDKKEAIRQVCEWIQHAQKSQDFLD